MTLLHGPYAITEVFCIIYAGIILFHLNDSIGTENEVMELKHIIVSYIVLLLMDIIWALSCDFIINPPDFVYKISSALITIAFPVGCYFWYRFARERLRPSYMHNKKIISIFNIPIFAIIVLDIASIFTGWIFYTDENYLYHNGKLFWLQLTVDYFYLIIPTVNALYCVFKTRSRSQKYEYMMYAVYMIAPLLAGTLEDFFPTVPVVALSFFMAIHLLFLMIQNMQIYNDALTNLNNRRRLNKYLEEKIDSSSNENRIVIFMLDINRFKFINDSYGHVEGDHALITFSDALKMVSCEFSTFIARYGGDEFCLVTKYDDNIVENIQNCINASVKRAQEKNGSILKYELTTSIGYSICDSSDINPDILIKKADDMLYANKRRWHKLNG